MDKKYELADKFLDILNDEDTHCEQCPLSEPCDVFQEEEHNSICGVLTEITAEYEEEQETKEIENEFKNIHEELNKQIKKEE